MGSFPIFLFDTLGIIPHNGVMNIQETFTKNIENYSAISGYAPSTVCLQIFNDGKAYKRIKDDNADCTGRKIVKLKSFLTEKGIPFIE